MTRKKQAVAATVKIPEPEADGHYYFTQVELLKFELSSERLLRATAEMKLSQFKIDEAKRAADAIIAKLTKESAGRSSELSARAAEHAATLGSLRQKYHFLDFEKMTYDNETGKITILP